MDINLKKLLITLIVLLLNVHPQSISKMSPFAKGQALSDAYSAYAKDSEAIFYNPASTFYGFKNNIYLNHAQWFGDTSLTGISYRNRLNSKLALGGSFLFYSFGQVPVYNSDESPFILDSDGYWVLNEANTAYFYETLIIANASYMVNVFELFFPIGLNLKTSTTKIDLNESLFSTSLDAGILFPLQENFTFKNKILKSAVPENVSLKIADINLFVKSMNTMFNSQHNFEFLLGLGNNLLKIDNLYNLKTEIDISSKNGIAFGNINDFYLLQNKLNLSLLSGINYDTYDFFNRLENISEKQIAFKDRLRYSYGLFADFTFMNVHYNVGYSMRHWGDLGNTHQISIEVDMDIDKLGNIFGFNLTEKRKIETTQLIQTKIKTGDYNEAKYLLKQLMEKYPNDEEIKIMYERIEEIEKGSDLFFY